jgi:MATE family multidrug resistance protein
MGYRHEIRELIRLATPLAAAQAGTQMMGLVDIAVLGRVGARELGGAGLGNAVFFAVSVIGIGIVYGVDPLISQAFGARDPARARRLLWQGSWLALVVSGALTLVLLALAALLPHFGVQPELVAPARTFLLIRMLSLAPFLLFFVVRSYLQAQHVTRPLVITMILANIVNFALDILLVFGAGPIPPLGVAGAALSTLAATFVELAIVAVAVRRITVAETVDHRWNAREVVQAFRVGLPVGLHMGAEVGIFALVGVLAARLGTLHLAAHQLVIGLASFTYTAILGVAAAGSVRVGNAIGARDARATRLAGHAAFIGGAAFMLVPALAFAFIPRAVARLITDQPDVLAAAIPLFLVAAVFQMSDGIQGVGAGVLRGAGDTKFTFYANLLGHWFIGFPIALWLGFHLGLGIAGLWWGLCAGLTVVAVLLFIRFEKLSRGEIVPMHP